MKNKLLALTVLLSTASLSACTMSNIRDFTGSGKQMPDEFMVESRPNLVVPNQFTLPAPEDAPIPNLERNNQAAQKLLTGTASSGNTAIGKGEQAILQKANAAATDDSIKKTVYQEHREDAGKGVFGVKKGGFMEKVLDPFGYNAPKDPEIDVEAERNRIKKAIKDGKPITGDAVMKK
jgi:hypothetical protein